MYNKCTADCQVLTANMKDVTAWQRGEIVFNKATIAEIIQTLERHFGIMFYVSTKKRNQDRYNFVFKENAGLEEVLAPYEDVLADVKQRDYQDTHRAAAPLKQADDAVLLDTSELNFEQSFEAMKKMITEKVR